MAVDKQLREVERAFPATASAPAPVPFHVAAGLLRGLNREQRAAVQHGRGPLVVIAGPGTGKTEVITRRLAWLIATKRAKPHEILALTFTDNAAEEMQARVDVLVPYGHADAAIHTFHAFGDRLLREFAFEMGLRGDLRLISGSEATVLLREHLFELGLDDYRPLGDPTRFLRALADCFARAKDEDISVQTLLEYARSLSADDPAGAEKARRSLELATAFERYQALLTQRGLIDHGDQVALTLRLLRDHAAVRATVTGRYRFVLVDEFQDMSSAQMAFLRELTGLDRNVTVVGDPAQAIYAFRGAGSDNVAAFAGAHPDLRRIVLRRNYRSRRPIVEAARRLMSHAAGGAQSARQAAQRAGRAAVPVRSVCYETPEEEADGVAAAIADALGAGSPPADFAVLARSNGEVEAMARSLRVRGIPVRTQLPSDFFALPEVRPLLAYLRVVADPEQTLELFALSTSEPYLLGGEELTSVLAFARRRHTSLWHVITDAEQLAGRSGEFRDVVHRLVADVRSGIALAAERSSTEVLYDYLRRSGRLARLAQAIDPSRPRQVARFFEIVRSRARLLAHDRVPLLVPHLDALIEVQDELADDGPPDLDAVSVLTVHRAKGLEFRVVYVTGLTDGRFPARGRPPTIDIPWGDVRGEPAGQLDRLDEERRLCFVAMTRARDELWLSHHSSGREGRGRRRPSPFIAEALDTPATAAKVGLDAIAQIDAIGTPQANVSAPSSAARPQTSFSFSELETYLDCPARYRLRHVVGLPSSPHHALTYGSAMHQAVAAFHVGQRNGNALSEDELLKSFANAWSPEGFLSREHEEARYQQGREALRRFRQAQLEEPAQVIAVERPFVTRLDDVEIRGRIDRVDNTDEGAVIVDYKSSDVRDPAKADERARDSLQLSVYAMAYEAECGSLPAAVRLHFLDSGVVGSARPEPARLERARGKLRTAVEGIRHEKFEPRPNAVTCGYCPFRQICPSSAA